MAVLALYAYLLYGVRWFARVLPEMRRLRIKDVLPAVATGGQVRLTPTHDAEAGT
ncbi:MAG: hypothetical protein JWP61_370 [Friedmanniella sp.]|nr:hypothetical protein [Friedmanniella sp.]